MEEVYPGLIPHRFTIHRWTTKFDSGDYSVEDQPKSGRPSELDLSALKDLVESDPELTIREMAAELHHSTSVVWEGLHKINKKRKLGRWVPHELTDWDKERRVDMSLSLLTLQGNDYSWLDHLVTGDEKWVLYDNHVRHAQWVDADEQPSDTPKPELHQKKVMLSIWWGVSGPIYWELLPEGQTINAEYYAEQLRRLKLKIVKKHGAQWKVMLLHDNARPHVAKKVKSQLASFGWTVLSHPPYSPDLAPSDYHLFSAMQNTFKDIMFDNRDEVEIVIKKFIKDHKAPFWREGIEKLPERWRKVVNANGEYFH
jgi:histone-lysine N-methyltransferase SETMAR